MTTPESLVRLIEEFERLPGIGRRSAERLAHYLLRGSEERALALAEAIREARARIRSCSLCRAPCEIDPCPICRDPARDRSLLMVLETARDLAAVESSGGYPGLYYVLGDHLSPLEGVRAKDLDLEGLRRRIEGGKGRDGLSEVCLATNPDLEGDGTALLVQRALSGSGIILTRLARGLPSGGQIEYQSTAVLAEAFEERRTVVDDATRDGRNGAGVGNDPPAPSA